MFINGNWEDNTEDVNPHIADQDISIYTPFLPHVNTLRKKESSASPLSK